MKICGIEAKVYIRRCLTHIPVGIAISWLVMLGWTKKIPSPYCFLPAIAGILLYKAFIRYEENEDHHIKDKAYPDIAGCAWGLIFYMVFIFGLK